VYLYYTHSCATGGGGEWGTGVKLSIDGKYNKSVSSMLRRVYVRGPRERGTSCREREERAVERERERERVSERPNTLM